MELKPIVMGEFHCDPACPFLHHLPGEDHNTVDAICKKSNKPLDWHDYWLAICIEDDNNSL